MKRYLIGVDLGTSSTKAAIYTPDGNLVAEASVEVPLYHPKPGVVEQENDDFYSSAAQTVRQSIQSSGIDPREVAAIAFDSQMAGVGSVSDQFQAATRFDSWLDMRCQPYIEQLSREAGGLITRLSGCPPTCDHGPKILWWQHERPEEYARVAKFLMPAGYVAGRMAGLRGEDAFIDYTFIHFSALSDAQAGTWSPELCRLLGVNQEKLPRIVSPWTLVGEVSDSSARDFGLAAGTPIAAGAGDTAAGALGAGVVRSGMLLDTAGTAAVLAGCTNQYTPDEANRALLIMRSVIPGLWNPLAYIAGGGLALRWFRDKFYNSLHGESQPSAGDLYDEMTAAAESIPPGADGLFFSPHLGGRICPAEPSMRGAWIGFSWTHTQAHFFRAVLESVAFEYAYYLHILRGLIPPLNLIEARVIGGGARSPVWNQIKANVLNVPYQPLQRSEFATWGSALIAGYAVGLFSNLAETAIETSERRGDPLQPDPEQVALYQPLSSQYRHWQESLSQNFVSSH
ncbi:MAG: xylulose kinase [Anaerolineae bacterium]|nr:xylulose kinase [Anaerolineae bacterium]